MGDVTKAAASGVKLPSRATIWHGAKVVLAVALVVVVVTKTSAAEMSALLGRLSWPWLLAFLAASYSSFIFLTYRYWLLIERQITFRQALNLVIVQAVVGNLVASVAGMASYVAILRARYDVHVTQSVASLVIARVVDVAVLLAALVLSSAMVWPQVEVIGWLVAGLALTLAGVLVVLGLAFVYRGRMAELTEHVLRVMRIDRFGVVRRGLEMLRVLAQHDLTHMRPLLGPVTIASVFLLGCSVVSSYCSVQLFHIPIGVPEIIFMVVLVQLMSVVPIHVLGGLGVSDLTVMYIYVLFGVGEAAIAPVIVAARLIFYAMNLLLVLYIAGDALLRRGADA